MKAGDLIFIPGGRVHAIGAGCLILEVQLNSNTTFRLYDWDRVGHDGKKRDLHLKESLLAIDWKNADVISEPISTTSSCEQVQDLLKTPYFEMSKIRIDSGDKLKISNACFDVLFVEKGNVTVIYGDSEPLRVGVGSSVLVTAELGVYGLATDEEAVLLRTTVPASSC